MDWFALMEAEEIVAVIQTIRLVLRPSVAFS